jgi:XRE family transcriptional regulator, regulator of sulfur utilization
MNERYTWPRPERHSTSRLASQSGDSVKSDGISQEELGHKTGLHRNHVGQIERAELNPTLATVDVIAQALALSPTELIAPAEQQRGGKL